MFDYPKQYDVIVVGGGHAGIEASLAAARMGCETLMLTSNPDTIGQMSCNPAIGGQAKSHLVKEIDALGGEMAKTTDLCGIQFRVLNTKKGPAVWSTRAQCDKRAYQIRMKLVCERTPRLDVKLGQCSELLVDGASITGVRTDLGVCFQSKTVVITTGTFLSGILHVGAEQKQGGRAGDGASVGLSKSLADLGFGLGRLKTGTPPRLSRNSIDFSRCEEQAGDDPVPFLSFWKDELFHVEHERSSVIGSRPFETKFPTSSVLAKIGRQSSCFLTRTTNKTAEIIASNLNKSAVYSGTIKGTGPRYCPSIEDKIVRFADKQSHQIFLEPEGIETDEIYVNGFSTSMPFDVQYNLVRSIIGCEKAEIVRPAYAVEYDYLLSGQIRHSLESKIVSGLFFAGQINGTSGYEEAAAQGLIAGANAAQFVLNRPPLILGREQAYIGVLIDDLVTKETSEPYRIFTSRAEHRLLLRQDNADVRLTEQGFGLGLVSKERYASFKQKQLKLRSELVRLSNTRKDGILLSDLLKRPEISYADVADVDSDSSVDIGTAIEAIIKYEGYANRQASEIQRMKSLEDRRIPTDINYDLVPSLKTEARHKLKKFSPSTLGQAAKVSGVSPSDISNLMIWMCKHK